MTGEQKRFFESFWERLAALRRFMIAELNSFCSEHKFLECLSLILQHCKISKKPSQAKEEQLDVVIVQSCERENAVVSMTLDT